MSSKNKETKKCCSNLGKYGGQAVIEGVMMMGKSRIATAIRKSDGTIMIDNKEHIRITNKYKWLNIPILRGCISFFDSMIVGVKSLMFSAEQFDIEEENEESDKNEKDKKNDENKEETMPEWLLVLTMLFSLAISIGLFIILPSFIANLIKNFAGGYIESDVVYSIIESIIRLLIFFLYLIMISFQEDVKRVFQYHGAEHKTINCYEAGEELNVENAMKQSRFNPRCGTSFLFIVMIISIIIYSIPLFKIRSNVFETMGIRIVLLPLIAGISYEIIKLFGTNQSKLAKKLSAPGMWFQGFTTREPDEKQIEVAISALKATMEEEKSEEV